MARSIRSDAVNHGRNAEVVPYQDQKYVRCSRCGFICHADRDDSQPEGSRASWGNTMPETTLNGSVAKNDTTINVFSTTGFSSSGSIYIYETGLPYSSSRALNDKVEYTGITSTSFTGCTSVSVHSTGMMVRGEIVTAGCPQCGSFLFNK